MGLGVLDDSVMDHVPGTTRYFDDPERPQFASDGVTGLKCDNSGPTPIILVPQPSDDPNDPLNWPLWRRDLITFILSLTAIFATALGPILAANTFTLFAWFSVQFTDIAILTGYFLLGVGAAGVFFVPTGRIWGKRHLFVVGTVILIASSAWGGSVGKNYNSMVGARIVQGIGCAPFEAFVNAVVGDLYFVHQRGIRMAFTNLAVFGGAFFTPILVGKITHTISWWWTFYLVAIFCAVCLPAIIFFCPETAYRRDASLNLDLLDTDNPGPSNAGVMGRQSDSAETSAGPEMEKEKENEARAAAEAGNAETNGVANAPQTRQVKKVSFIQSLALFNGRKTDESFFKLLLRPFPLLFFHPAFLWASLIQGVMIGWTVFIGVILAQFFLGPPLWWDEVKTGYAYTAAFIGAIVGFIIAGALADWSARVMTRRNNGVYEPEFRIVLVIPQLIIGCMGIFGWGMASDLLSASEVGYQLPLFFFACEVAGMVIGAVASSLYIVDAYRDLAIEGFTCMIIFKNFFSFALTFKAYRWIIQESTTSAPVFNILGYVQIIICLTSIPLYIYGKRIRSYYYRHDLLAFFHLR